MELAISIIVALCLVVGALGTIFPVLPGSLLIIVSLGVWGFVIGGAAGWGVFAVGALLCLVGMASSAVLTGKALKKREIPNRSIIIGAVCGLVGTFVIPVVGLFVGFAIGLWLAEWYRLQEPQAAWQSALVALKHTGIGMLIEFGCACLAIFTFAVGLLIHFSG